jgi:hypothetical protein
MSGGQKTPPLCFDRIVAALEKISRFFFNSLFSIENFKDSLIIIQIVHFLLKLLLKTFQKSAIEVSIY